MVNLLQIFKKREIKRCDPLLFPKKKLQPTMVVKARVKYVKNNMTWPFVKGSNKIFCDGLL